MQGKKKLYSATIFACLKEHRMLCSPKTSCILCINFTVFTACRGLLSRHHPKIHKYMISCYLWVTWLSQSGFWLTHWFICSLKDNFSQNRKKLIKKKIVRSIGRLSLHCNYLVYEAICSETSGPCTSLSLPGACEI